MYLQRAVDLAVEGVSKGGGPFGAVIVKDGKLVAEAFNEVVYTGDPTAHAEVLAIRKACEILGSHELGGCVLYTSCEPCPMCLGAVYWSGIDAVYYASDREDAEKAGFGDNHFYEELYLEPEKRSKKFIQVKDVDGSVVFDEWNRFENKVPY